MIAGEVSNTSPRLSETKDSNPYAYTLEILTITNNEGISMDVRNMMGECKIFEAITNNFLMGELIIIDSITPPLFKQLLFTGQESLRIKFRMGGDEGNPHNFPSIDKLFRIYKVSNFQRHDQTTIAYKLSFCSPEFLTSRRFRVSKVYRGSHIEVAGKIGQEYLSFQEPPDPIETKVSVEEAEDRVFETETYSYFPYWQRLDTSWTDDNHQFVFPNWSVNYTINWLCNQYNAATNAIDNKKSVFESVFFWYESAYGSYKIRSLGDMIQDKYLPGVKFYYSPAEDSSTLDEDNTKGLGQRILGYEAGTHADVIEGTVFGLFAGEQVTVDMKHKQVWEHSWSYLDSPSQIQKDTTEEGEKGAKGMIGKDGGDWAMVRTTPENFWIGKPSNITEDGGETNIQELDSIHYKPKNISEHANPNQSISNFTEAYSMLDYQTSNIFGEGYKYSNEANEGLVNDTLIKQAAKTLLKYNTITAKISARSDISTGKMIDLYITSPGDTGSGPLKEDPMNSGEHLITEIMWDLTPEEMTTNITCMKDSCLDNVGQHYEKLKTEFIEPEVGQ